MDWRKLQEVTAELFRRLGCSAEIDKLVHGARAEHKIDVWVVFDKFGFQNKWCIECKYWNTHIPKEKVMALRAIVEDVGADRGVIISKTGFQSGAIRAATRTNIILTSIEDLRETVKDDLDQSALYQLENKTTRLRYELQNLYEVEQTGPNSLVSRPLPGIDGDLVMRATGRLSVVGLGFDRIRLAEPPYPVAFDNTGNKILAATTVESFVEQVSSLVLEVETLLDTAIKNMRKTTKTDA